MGLPPGPRLPRVAQSAWYVLAPDTFFQRAARRYGTPCTVRIVGETWVLLDDPATIAEVFQGSPDVLRSGEANAALGSIIGTRNTLLLDGDEHLQRRRTVLPSFHGERVASYRDIVTEVTRRSVDTWPRNSSFPLLGAMQDITFEVILRAVFGVDERAGLDHLGNQLRALMAWTTNLPRAIALNTMGPQRTLRLASFRRALDPVHAELDRLVAQRRRDATLGERTDVLSALLRSSQLTDEDLRDELVTLLVAGHETTAAALGWCFEALLRDPSSWARLQAGEPGWAEAIARETLRLHPPVPLVLRRLAEPMRIGGVDLPAGATVAPCAYLVHFRDDLYPEPRAFRPQRFLDTKPGTYTWLPFGGGVRRCLGQALAMLEITTVLETVAANVELAAPTPRHERIGRRAVVLVPGRGARAVVT